MERDGLRSPVLYQRRQPAVIMALKRKREILADDRAHPIERFFHFAYMLNIKQACAEANTLLRFSKPSGDFQGANESEIGLLFFATQDQTPEAVLNQWPAVHRALIKRLNASRV